MKIATLKTKGLNAAAIALFAGAILLFVASPVVAHHPSGGNTPTNALTGFLSGLGHPIIGLDHFVFVVAMGLLAALKARGIWIPVAFVCTAIVGTGLHLMGLDLPFPELIISASVLGIGILLALRESPNAILLAGFGAIAGLFHGYAYGEAIVGAEMTPLVAYLAGFTLIQLAIAILAFFAGRFALKNITEQPALTLRFAGFTICGAGAAFLAGLLV